MLNAEVNYEEMYRMSHNKEWSYRKKDSVSKSWHFSMPVSPVPLNGSWGIHGTEQRWQAEPGPWEEGSFIQDREENGREEVMVGAEVEEIPARPHRLSPRGMLGVDFEGARKAWSLRGITEGPDQGWVKEPPLSSEEPGDAGNHKCVERISSPLASSLSPGNNVEGVADPW